MAVGRDERVPVIDCMIDRALHFLWRRGMAVGRYRSTTANARSMVIAGPSKKGSHMINAAEQLIADAKAVAAIACREIDANMLDSMSVSFRARMGFSFHPDDMADLMARCAKMVRAHDFKER